MTDSTSASATEHTRSKKEIEEQLERVEECKENAEDGSEYLATLNGQSIALKWVLEGFEQ